MIPYNDKQKEYFEFKLKFLDKIKDLKQDFDKLSEDNKTRVMVEIHKTLPIALFNFEQKLNYRKWREYNYHIE